MSTAPVDEMIRKIAQDCMMCRGMIGKDQLDPNVIQAIREVPREVFVPDSLRKQAYENRPLPIGKGQTISQPFIVALMTDALNLKPNHRVLEIGTGSGYQAAVLSRLVDHVYTLEVVPELSQQAASRFDALGYSNISCRLADGFSGWAEQGPYDGIIVTAAPDRTPPVLLDQLSPGARLVIPVGPGWDVQKLKVYHKDSQERIAQQDLIDVAFVPMVSTGSAAVN